MSTYSRPELFMSGYPTSGYWPDLSADPRFRIGGTRADTLKWMTQLVDITVTASFSVTVFGMPTGTRTASFNRSFSFGTIASSPGLTSLSSLPCWFYQDAAGTPWPDSGSRILVNSVAGAYESPIFAVTDARWSNNECWFNVIPNTVGTDQKMAMELFIAAESPDPGDMVTASLAFTPLPTTPNVLTNIPFSVGPFGGNIILSYGSTDPGTSVSYTGPVLSMVATLL